MPIHQTTHHKMPPHIKPILRMVTISIPRIRASNQTLSNSHCSDLGAMLSNRESCYHIDVLKKPEEHGSFPTQFDSASLLDRETKICLFPCHFAWKIFKQNACKERLDRIYGTGSGDCAYNTYHL
jgi:hypothetical protein